MQHRVRIDLEDPCGAANAQALSEAADHVHDEVTRDALAVEQGAMGLQKIAIAAGAVHLPPGPTAGMAIGPDVAQAEPAAIATVGSRTALLGGVDLAPASSRRDQQRWRGAGRLTARRDALFTGVAGGLTGRAAKGLGGARALAGWRDWLGWWRSHCSGLSWPQPVEPQEYPHQGDQHKLGEKQVWYHSNAPSSRVEMGVLYRVLTPQGLSARYGYT